MFHFLVDEGLEALFDKTDHRTHSSYNDRRIPFFKYICRLIPIIAGMQSTVLQEIAF